MFLPQLVPQFCETHDSVWNMVFFTQWVQHMFISSQNLSNKFLFLHGMLLTISGFLTEYG